MLDFKTLVGTPKAAAVYNLETLYASLDVKGTHTELRTAQKEALSEITARNTERDLVLKISTGAGKTTVGLLYLLGYMRQTRGAGVFLCPTIQLVEQVIGEANKLGMQALPYPSGEPHPPAACARGEAVLVCTYEKLFNAKSTFNRNDVKLVPAALVLDDAHAGSEIVRKQFTLRVYGEAFEVLKEILQAQCRSYHPTKWLDLDRQDPSDLLEVPHWIWAEHAGDVRNRLHAYAETRDFALVWPFLEAILPQCRCVLSGAYAEIAPEILPVENVIAFARAEHRLFMSATLADDSLLVRELGVAPTAALDPITPPSDRGLGERMILAPSLISTDLDRGFVMDVCLSLSKNYNVVVLTSSERLAKDWEAVGAVYFSGDDFRLGVKGLRSGDVRFAVFSQRYDGVDLADDACRVLVLDGVPYGEGLVDKIDAQMAFHPGGVRNKTIFRIEQGMGRAVRSHADYAVVLLVGQDIATYIGRREVIDAMTSDTRSQLELAFELAELVKKNHGGDSGAAVRQVIEQCLSRDLGWKEFYNQRVRGNIKGAGEISKDRISLAADERDSYLLAMSNAPNDALTKLREAISKAKLTGDEKGIYLQRLSRIALVADPVEAMKIQQGARQHCSNVALPPALPVKALREDAKPIAQRVCAWLKEYSSLNAAVIQADKLHSSFDFSAKFRVIESVLMTLGTAIGAESSRPEIDFSRGPDNLWIWGDRMFVIEVKSEARDSLHKKDSGQLHDSIQWAKETYPEFAEKIVPLIVTNVTSIDSDAHYPEGARVINETGCKALAMAFRQLCAKLALEGPVFNTPDHIHQELAQFKLLPEQFSGNFTSLLKK